MRIISGKYKGRTINMPLGIRPTQNKARKALFDILGDIQGLSFLELFAGSGAVGLEALSGGVASLTLVENNRDCLVTLKKNIEPLKPEFCNLLPLEAEKAIRAFAKDKRKFDIIFLDPPYSKGNVPRHYASRSSVGDSGSKVAAVGDSLSKKTLQTLEVYDILAPNGLVIVQHFKKDTLPDKLGVLTLFRQAKYGDTVLSFYKHN